MEKKLLWIYAVVVFCLSLTVSCGGSGGGGGFFFLPPGAAKQNVVFVTSGSGNGNMGSWADAGGKNGLQAADAICQAHANRAGLPGTYRAFLSDENNDAYCRMQGLNGKAAANCGVAGNLVPAGGPWVRTDGTPFSGAINDLMRNNGNNSVVYTPIRYDESGNLLPTTYYWTGSGADGTTRSYAAYNGSCNNWTASSVGGSNLTIYSYSEVTTQLWGSYIGGDLTTCKGATMSLVCFQTGAGPALGAFAKTGKKVFVTSGAYNGNLGGLAGATNKCQARAAAGNFANPGNFVAWISIAGTNGEAATNARDELGASNGPWVRPDGIVVAESLNVLLSGRLKTGISVTETGAYSAEAPWTGTNAAGNFAGFETCGDWTSNAAANHGYAGYSPVANDLWGSYYSPLCNANAVSLYCFEK